MSAKGTERGNALPRFAVTGGDGFLAWHTACRLRSTRRNEPLLLSRTDFAGDQLARSVDAADVVLHLAGVNRGETSEAVARGNVDLAERLSSEIMRRARPLHVVYANSVHSQLGTPYGRGKAEAARVVGAAVAEVGGTMTDMVLPNIFGEHGRPAYNSFVATFCHEVASGRPLVITQDRELPLLHAQTAAEALIEAAELRTHGTVEPEGESHLISEVARRLRGFKAFYDASEIPDLSDPFDLDLFNTYRSFLFPERYPIFPKVHEDQRGRLFETLRAQGPGQSFVSTTLPGERRGEHYHLSRIERFVVLQGEAEIALRRLLHNEVVRFRISGDRPAIIDMPTMWVHNLSNVGDSELVTMFWSNQLLDPESPDQYQELVDRTETGE